MKFNYVLQEANVVNTISHHHPNLISARKVGACPNIDPYGLSRLSIAVPKGGLASNIRLE
jgi:hypothetical protein